MRPVSDAFLRTIRGSHKAFSRATILTTYQEGTAPIGTDVAILDGAVTSDAQASIRGRLTLRVDGTRAFPDSPAGLYTPYGHEVFVQRGIEFGNGATEVVSLGYYRIYDVEQPDAPDGPIDITALDRMSGLIDARLEAPRQFDAGTALDTVFYTLVHEVYPTATILFDFSASGALLEANHVADQDRFGFLRDIAKSRGKVMFWDYAGRLRIEDPPSPRNPVFKVNHGRDGVLLSLKRSLTRAGIYNVVVAVGERPSTDIAPVRAVARDVNPASATYVLGSFGPVPRFYSSPFITTADQAASAASKILQRAMGLPYSASFEALVNPALEALDPVSVTFADRSKEEIHVLETVTIPLVVKNPLTATTREQSTVLIEVDQ